LLIGLSSLPPSLSTYSRTLPSFPSPPSIGLLVSFGHIDGLENTEIENESHSPQVGNHPLISCRLTQSLPQEVADGIQDLLISMEMLFAAIAFTYSFSVADFEVYEKRIALPSQEDLSHIQQLKIETNLQGGGVGGGGDLQSTLLAAEQNMGGHPTIISLLTHLLTHHSPQDLSPLEMMRQLTVQITAKLTLCCSSRTPFGQISKRRHMIYFLL
jgi:hypothetical protein